MDHNATDPATPALPPGACPLCGAFNQCAAQRERETGVKQEACWCTQVDFSAATLARIPAEYQRKVCICPACAALTS